MMEGTNSESGLCVKDLEMRVTFQNDCSKRICGSKVGQICDRSCKVLHDQMGQGSPFTEGMKLFKAVELATCKADVVLVNESSAITTFFYPLGDLEEKAKQKETYLRERGLTKSELRIMEMVMQGMTNAAIAEKLFISKATLKTHLNNIYKKLPAAMRPSQARA